MFKVHKTKEFADRIMPCYFNQTHYKSFQRQLNSYRFHRFVAGKNKGTCFHELFMRDKPDLCTNINRMKVTRGRPHAALVQQTLPLDNHAPSPKAPLGLSIRESLEADDLENFLRIFNSAEVDPLECPSVTIFDDEEEDLKLGRTTSSANTATALHMGESEFQDKNNFFGSLFDAEPQQTNSNAMVPQYSIQFPVTNENFDYSFFCGASNNASNNNCSSSFSARAPRLAQ
jgi:hypothetical protein